MLIYQRVYIYIYIYISNIQAYAGGECAWPSMAPTWTRLRLNFERSQPWIDPGRSIF